MATPDDDIELVDALFNDLRDTVRDAERRRARSFVGSFRGESEESAIRLRRYVSNARVIRDETCH